MPDLSLWNSSSQPGPCEISLPKSRSLVLPASGRKRSLLVTASLGSGCCRLPWKSTEENEGETQGCDLRSLLNSSERCRSDGWEQKAALKPLLGGQHGVFFHICLTGWRFSQIMYDKCWLWNIWLNGFQTVGWTCWALQLCSPLFSTRWMCWFNIKKSEGGGVYIYINIQ